MPNPSHRIAKAAEESAKATRRIVAAEGKIAGAFMDMVRNDDASEDAPPPLPPKIKTPPKNQPPRK